jgi:hypothetical protein
VLLLNECLSLCLFRYRLSPETFGYTLIFRRSFSADTAKGSFGRFGVSMAIKVQVVVFKVVTPSFGGLYCLHLQGEVPEDCGVLNFNHYSSICSSHDTYKMNA